MDEEGSVLRNFCYEKLAQEEGRQREGGSGA